MALTQYISMHYLHQYCDMTPESRNSQLLDNSSLKRVSAATDEHRIIEKLLEMVISIRCAPKL
jgi:hypothetical protein